MSDINFLNGYLAKEASVNKSIAFLDGYKMNKKAFEDIEAPGRAFQKSVGSFEDIGDALKNTKDSIKNSELFKKLMKKSPWLLGGAAGGFIANSVLNSLLGNK